MKFKTNVEKCADEVSSISAVWLPKIQDWRFAFPALEGFATARRSEGEGGFIGRVRREEKST